MGRQPKPEREVAFQLIMEGKTNREIASICGVHEKTASTWKQILRNRGFIPPQKIDVIRNHLQNGVGGQPFQTFTDFYKFIKVIDPKIDKGRLRLIIRSFGGWQFPQKSPQNRDSRKSLTPLILKLLKKGVGTCEIARIVDCSPAHVAHVKKRVDDGSMAIYLRRLEDRKSRIKKSVKMLLEGYSPTYVLNTTKINFKLLQSLRQELINRGYQITPKHLQGKPPELGSLVREILKENPNITHKEVMKRVGCSMALVAQIKKRMGLSKPKPHHFNAGQSAKRRAGKKT